MNWNLIAIIYTVVINLVSFFLMGIDKWKAVHGKWRIKEKTLWTYFIIGGSVGGFLGMYLFHHKTKHRIFTMGIPLVFVLQFALIVYLWVMS